MYIHNLDGIVERVLLKISLKKYLSVKNLITRVGICVQLS